MEIIEGIFTYQFGSAFSALATKGLGVKSLLDYMLILIVRRVL